MVQEVKTYIYADDDARDGNCFVFFTSMRFNELSSRRRRKEINNNDKVNALKN